MPKKKVISNERGAAPLDLLPATCTTGQFGGLVKLRERGVRELSGKGIIVQDSRSRIKTVESLHRYVEHLRDTKAGRANGENSLATARAKLAEAQLIEQQMRNAKTAGDLISVEDARQAFAQFATTIRTAILALPSRARAQIAHLTAHDGQTLRQICVDVLTEAAEELDGGDVPGSDRDLLAADEAAPAPVAPPAKKPRQRRSRLDA